MSDNSAVFEGKVAFVTGAANGIGRATALAFAREGANVAIADVSNQGNQETGPMVEEPGRRVLVVSCDVSRAEDVKSALDKTIEAFGAAGLRLQQRRYRAASHANGRSHGG